jgi:hypothetical protein
VVAAALALPAIASAHPRTATVAIDYRLTLEQAPTGVEAAVLDGDRALRLRVTPGHTLVVLGDLGEPMLRFANGVWVNEHSPTAQANRLIGNAGTGWRRLAGGSTFAWHEHRLSPPPYDASRLGPVARWSVPLLLDGRHAAVGGAFVRVARPHTWLWLGGAALLVAAALSLVRFRPRSAVMVTVAAGTGAGVAALVAQTAFALRDSPGGHASWLSLGISVAVGAVAAWLVVAGRGARRAYVAGAIGAGVAALTLSWFAVFLHGAIVAALPALPVRVACTIALGGGVLALVGALSIRAEDA